MKVTALTLLILQINSLIDSGKYNDITISEVHEAIESQELLRFIKKKMRFGYRSKHSPRKYCLWQF